MKRFVTYLYQYDRGIRCKNTGFVKADVREDSYRMEIQVRGLGSGTGRAQVFFLICDNDSIGIPAGEFNLCQGSGSLQLKGLTHRLGQSTYRIDQIAAIVIRYGSGRLLISCWKEKIPDSVCMGKFTVWEQPVIEEPACEACKSSEKYPQKESPVLINENDQKEDCGECNENGRDEEEEGTEEDTCESKDDPKAANQQAPEKTDAGKDKTDSAKAQVSYRKIAIADIHSLPKKNWYLCNNSFLIHGFFNYHYLMLKTVEKDGDTTYYLGVPGVYEQPEYMMALLFGFRDFEPATDRKHKSETGVFGYWMTQLLT